MIVVTLPNGNIVRRSPTGSPSCPPRITLDEAVDAVQQLHAPPVAVPTLDEPRVYTTRVFARDIVTYICRSQRIKLSELVSPRRLKSITRARQLAYWLCKRHTALSLSQIGRQIGNRDHTTVLHGCRVIDRLIARDTDEAQAVRLIIDQCRRELGLPHDPN